MKKPLTRLLGIVILSVTIIIVIVYPLQKTFHFSLKDNAEEFEEEEEYKEGRQTGVEKELSTWLWSKGYPDPVNLSEKYWKAWLQAQEIKKNTIFGSFALREMGTSSFGNWTVLGNVANIGGRVLSIAIDPANANRIFVGTASGGIYKTTDAGSNWQYVPTGFPVLGVASILIDPLNSNVLYAGTGEVYRTSNSNFGYNVWKARGTYGVGILKSTDGGATWSQVMNKNMSDLFAIQMLKFDPTNSNTIYACTTHGLFKSTDAGATWSATPILNKPYISDIAINPSNSNIIVAAVGNLVDVDKGVYRSTNGGTSWTASANATIGTSFNGYIRFDNIGSTRLFASVGNGSGNELYMSTDFGATWIQKTGSSHCGGQYWFGHDLAVDPSNPDRVVMGGVSYYTYTSASTTTSAGSSSSFASGVHADVHDIKFHPTNSNIIYIACDGGMYKTTNGSSFSAINIGLNATQFYASVAVSPTADIIIGGLQDNGVVKYNAGTWTANLVGGDGGPSAFAPNGTTVIYSNDARAVYQSTNTGSTETQRLTNMGYGYATAHDDRTAFMAPLGISKSNPSYMYVASDNLHISTNGGTSFQRPDETSWTRPIDAMYKPAIALAVSPTTYNKVYVSTSPLSQRADDALNYNPPAKVLKSLNADNNASYSFTNITGTLPDRFVTDFAISSTDDNKVYITLGGFGNTHVYLTTDGGTTWQPRGSGLPDIPFNAIVIDPVNPQILYAGCDFGVYVSPDGGVNWYDFSNGMTDATMVYDLQISYNNKLIAATHGKGILRSDLFNISFLPVTFKSFTAQNTGNHNQLIWEVEQENDLSYYDVEKSTDGSGFNKITSLAARGSYSPTSYTYKDNITASPSATFYYRLKAVNKDGSYKYSKIVVITLEKRNEIRIIGNPFYSHVSIQSHQTTQGEMSIRLYDMQGKLLKTEKVNMQAGYGTHSVNDLSFLPCGTYLLEIGLNGKKQVEKVIKQQ